MTPTGPCAALRTEDVAPARWLTCHVRRLVIFLALVSTAGWAAAIDTISGTVGAEIEFRIPDPDEPGQMKTVILGEMVGRLGSDRLQQRIVIGFRKTYQEDICCDALHFMNIVVADPNPPRWIDADGKAHEIGAREAYIDPLSGGNVRRGQDKPIPEADRLPWYDIESRGAKASATGDFNDGEKKEYDLNDFTIKDSGFDWTTDPVLDLVFADAPTLTPGLRFVTLLVCREEKVFCPIAGITWGLTPESNSFIGDIFEGADFPEGLTTEGVTAALRRSGFGDYRMREPPCCTVPEPGVWSLVVLAMIGASFMRRRQ